MSIQTTFEYNCLTCRSSGGFKSIEDWKCPECKSINIIVRMKSVVHELFLGANVENIGGGCSDPCDYCQRSVFPVYKDDIMCQECCNYDNFIGIACVATKVDE